VTVTEHTLILLRHAKAEHVAGVPDVARELTSRGLRDAEAIGQWFAEHELAPDLVVCSTSARTRQTWETAAESGAEAAEVSFDKRVYNAGVETLLEVIREAPESAGVLVVVGHGPGIPWLAADLAADSGGSEVAYARMEEGFPTSGLAVLSYSGRWADLGPEDALLEDFAAPRG
jgi:phosphohistidine phosphatase